MNHLHPIPTRSMRAFVWDLADEGLDEVFDRLQDCGTGGLHLALAYHGGRFFCPHNPRHTIVHAPDGVVYFRPELTCYEGGLIPRQHPEYGSGQFVNQVRMALENEGMRFSAWAVLFNNGMLSEHFPHCMCVNAMGDRLQGTLCPSNSSVRQYAQAMVEDLACRVGAHTVELEDFTFPSLKTHAGTSWRMIDLQPNIEYLLSLCFCDSCRQRAEEANIEINDLKFHIERLIRGYMAGDMSDRRIGDEISDPYHPISKYATVRANTITTLLDSLAETVDGTHCELQLQLNEEPDEYWRWGLELHTLRQRQIHATVPVPNRESAAHALLERFSDLTHLTGHELLADLSLKMPQSPEELTFSAMIDLCEHRGITRFVFSHYGLASMDMLDLLPVLAN